MSVVASDVPRSFVPYLSFGAFGLFWGTWGASLPAIRAQAAVSDAELGTALLFVGAGALPAMVFTGRLLDRVGSRLTAILIAVLGATGSILTWTASDHVSLIASMALVGAASGAADVAINAVASSVESARRRPVLTRSHGIFSVAVVVSSLLAGFVLQAVGDGPRVQVTFAVAAGVLVAASVGIWSGTSFGASAAPSHAEAPSALPRRLRLPWPLILVGLLGAVAYATENAYQSWGAVFLEGQFDATAQFAAFAPAAFAAVAAVARLSLAPLSTTHPGALLVGGGLTASVGSVILWSSADAPQALVGIALAALGTATLFPTLLSRATRSVPEGRRGAATSAVAATAYLGFLLGPACIGFLSDAFGLRQAFLAVAIAAVGFGLAAAPLSRWAAARVRARPFDVGSPIDAVRDHSDADR